MATAGSFMWNELATAKPDQAISFYREVLGWASREMDMGPMGTYTVLSSAGEDIAGVMAQQEPGAAASWLSYVQVDDVDVTVEKAQSAGGEVLQAPYDVPGVGRMAVLADPTGARLAVMKPADG